MQLSHAAARAHRAGSLLLTASAAAIALVSSPAFATEEVADGADDDGEIVVSGSAFQNLEEIEARRDTTAIVDTLSRDEIGALPDITIAESLRRITGVTTIYNDDIGQFASIRGTHSDFIPVTINGLSEDSQSEAMGLIEAAAFNQAYLVWRVTYKTGAQRVFYGTPSIPGESLQRGGLGTGSFGVKIKGRILKLPAVA